MSLFTIGSSNTDLVIYLDHIPKIGETVIGGESSIIFGGKGANQAVAAKRAGADIKFVTQLGNDSFGEGMKKHLMKEDLPQEYILKDKNQPSGIAQIFVSKKGENSIAVASGSNGTLTFDRLKPFIKDLSSADIVLVQFEIPIETVMDLIDFCFNKGVKTLVNPAPAIKLTPEKLSKIWMITPNESEAEILTGITVNNQQNAINAAQMILAMGVEHCIVTLGEKGSVWISKNGAFHFTVPRVNSVDSTAAGDVFNGYLAAGVTKDLPLEKAIVTAHAAASLSVTVKGAQTSIPKIEKTQLFLKQNPIEIKKIF